MTTHAVRRRQVLPSEAELKEEQKANLKGDFDTSVICDVKHILHILPEYLMEIFLLLKLVI